MYTYTYTYILYEVCFYVDAHTHGGDGLVGDGLRAVRTQGTERALVALLAMGVAYDSANKINN